MHGVSGVQPNPVYSLGGAVFGTALVCALLLWAFTHPLPLQLPLARLQLHLLTRAAAPLRRVRQPPARRTVPLSQPHVARFTTPKPIAIPKTGALTPNAPSVPLDLSLPGLTFAPPAASPFVPQVFNPYSDLSKALVTPSPPAAMHNGDAYRSVYGSPVVKSGGRCLTLQTLQVGLSPSARATVAFGMPCPGEYRPSMADELKAWADKEARKHHLPP